MGENRVGLVILVGDGVMDGGLEVLLSSFGNGLVSLDVLLLLSDVSSTVVVSSFQSSSQPDILVDFSFLC
jgi:hypothetical protein